VIKPFGRGLSGRVKITVTKDRAGHVRGFSPDGCAAIVELESGADGSVTVTLNPPADTQEATSSFRPTVLMERVAAMVVATPGLSSRQLREAVVGKAAGKALALRIVVEEGYVEARPHGQALHHYPLKPYTGEPGNPVPTEFPRTRFPGSLPLTGGTGQGTTPDPPSGSPLASLEDEARTARLVANHSEVAA
jgi:hypothetical protein